MVDPITSELKSVILSLIKPDHMGDPKMLEHLQVVLRAVSSRSLYRRGLVDWPHEGNELVGDDPIQVTVLHALVVFILFVVEVSESVPAETDRKL